MRRHFLLFPLTVMLAGCQTMSGSAPASWQNPALKTDAERERQFVIDNGRCRQVSMGSAPMPGPAIAIAPSSYQIAGSGYSASGGHQTYNATVTPVQSPGASFAQGVSNGMAIRRAIDARMAQDEIYRGCLYQLGWTQVSS